ncbi:hypothetical protein SBRCBS47491_004527 [Sporothrix bragantina]|uniref:Zn(2)-C6 fungal-type domain-containing protein n=1 Tax=Sporothrix bragantina TaxID=671064 RepID=A0ABP0BP15_9PEZI
MAAAATMDGISKLTTTRKTRRTANACVACRQSKIKCSGEEPCQNCQRRSLRCQFIEGNIKVVVTEKYLQGLQRLAEGHRPSPETTTATTTSNGDQQSQAGSQYGPWNAPMSLTGAPDARQTAQTFGTSPATRSSGTSEPSLCGNSRSSDAALGVPVNGSSPKGTSRNEPTSTPTSMISTVPFQLDTVRPGSGHGSVPGFGADSVPGPPRFTVGPSPGSNAQQQPQQQEPQIVLRQIALPLNRIWSSTFTTPSKVIRNRQKNERRWIWLAPWSTWSFTVRLTIMLSETLHPDDSSLPPSLFSTEIYELEYRTTMAYNHLPDVSGLPSLSHALYLFNAVKFHLSQTYRLYDEEEFEKQINDFYHNAHQRAAESPLWFSKFLLTMAFGTAFHAPPRDSADPPGSRFFVRAMALMPDDSNLWKNSFLAMEVLALGGLYLYSVDQREGANFFLGYALRIAQLEGMHTHLPEQELGEKVAAHARDLWWTLYIMDRHFSSSVGLPMAVQDSDVTVPLNLPSAGTAMDSARSLQVNLAHLMSIILTTVYKPNFMELAAFLEQTRSILHTLAHHAQDIERIVGIKFQESAGSMPRDTQLLTLLYHQCVIFATRPLLLSVMKERLDLLGFQGDENWTNFLQQTGSVISIGIKSAAKTLQILTSEFSVLDAFLPYDVEFTFGAALNLTMAHALFPDVVNYDSCRDMAHQILDDLVYRGNRVASARRSELRHLEGLCNELISRGQQHGLQTLQLVELEPPSKISLVGEQPSADSDSNPLANGGDPSQTMPAMHAMDVMHHHQPTSDMEFLDSIGISSEEFLSIVQQIGNSETFPENMLTLG